MRKKELKAVVTFHTTAEAMKFEKACKRENVKGHLITVPRKFLRDVDLRGALT